MWVRSYDTYLLLSYTCRTMLMNTVEKARNVVPRIDGRAWNTILKRSRSTKTYHARDAWVSNLIDFQRHTQYQPFRAQRETNEIPSCALIVRTWVNGLPVPLKVTTHMCLCGGTYMAYTAATKNSKYLSSLDLRVPYTAWHFAFIKRHTIPQLHRKMCSQCH